MILLSSDVLNTLYEANIQVTTTKNIKETYYSDNERVLTFEKLVEICLDNVSHWKNFNYTVEQNEQKFVEEYYDERLKNIKK